MPRFSEVEGYIHSVETMSAHDGPGLRYVVFFQGCPYSCLYCHNPDTRVFGLGQRVKAGDQIQSILRYRNYLSGGVTLSGGEPLAQPHFAEALANLCKENGLHCAIDTSGGVALSECKSAVDASDLVLLDFKNLLNVMVFQHQGFDMENTWALLDYCQSINKKVWARYVVVPGLTVLFENEGELINDFETFLSVNSALVEGIERIKRSDCVEKIEFLPFHKMGEYKWKEQDLNYALADIDVPSENMVAWCQKLI